MPDSALLFHPIFLSQTFKKLETSSTRFDLSKIDIQLSNQFPTLKPDLGYEPKLLQIGSMFKYIRKFHRLKFDGNQEYYKENEVIRAVLQLHPYTWLTMGLVRYISKCAREEDCSAFFLKIIGNISRYGHFIANAKPILKYADEMHPYYEVLDVDLRHCNPTDVLFIDRCDNRIQYKYTNGQLEFVPTPQHVSGLRSCTMLYVHKRLDRNIDNKHILIITGEGETYSKLTDSFMRKGASQVSSQILSYTFLNTDQILPITFDKYDLILIAAHNKVGMFLTMLVELNQLHLLRKIIVLVNAGHSIDTKLLTYDIIGALDKPHTVERIQALIDTKNAHHMSKYTQKPTTHVTEKVKHIFGDDYWSGKYTSSQKYTCILWQKAVVWIKPSSSTLAQYQYGAYGMLLAISFICRNLKDDGMAIIKTFLVMTEIQLQILQMITMLFKSVTIKRNPYKVLTDNKIYLQCNGFIGCEKGTEIYEKTQSMIHKIQNCTTCVFLQGKDAMSINRNDEINQDIGTVNMELRVKKTRNYITHTNNLALKMLRKHLNRVQSQIVSKMMTFYKQIEKFVEWRRTCIAYQRRSTYELTCHDLTQSQLERAANLCFEKGFHIEPSHISPIHMYNVAYHTSFNLYAKVRQRLFGKEDKNSMIVPLRCIVNPSSHTGDLTLKQQLKKLFPNVKKVIVSNALAGNLTKTLRAYDISCQTNKQSNYEILKHNLKHEHKCKILRVPIMKYIANLARSKRMVLIHNTFPEVILQTSYEHSTEHKDDKNDRILSMFSDLTPYMTNPLVAIMFRVAKNRSIDPILERCKKEKNIVSPKIQVIKLAMTDIWIFRLNDQYEKNAFV